MIAPFLKEGWGWTDPNRCWWREKDRQCREHLFKECTAWTKEIRRLWTAVGEASGGRDEAEPGFGSSKGYGYRVRQARAKPSNTSVRDLLSDDRYTEAVLGFIGAIRVGEVKRRIICRQFVDKAAGGGSP